MKILSVMFMVLPALISAKSFASCNQANFKSQDGSQVSVHYSSTNYTDGSSAWIFPSAHVTLTGDRCAAAKSVEITLVQVPSYNCGGPSNSYGKTVMLTQDYNNPCHYSELGKLSIGTANHCGSPGQEIAVKINYWNNSEWLVDPVSGGHNFKYSVSTYWSPTPDVCN